MGWSMKEFATVFGTVGGSVRFQLPLLAWHTNSDLYSVHARSYSSSSNEMKADRFWSPHLGKAGLLERLQIITIVPVLLCPNCHLPSESANASAGGILL